MLQPNESLHLVGGPVGRGIRCRVHTGVGPHDDRNHPDGTAGHDTSSVPADDHDGAPGDDDHDNDGSSADE